ncbi:MAG: hypothetical protein HOH25_01190 [Opitutae bacterium]|nr:hypothetical protein [Opitutae bacterium]
MKTNLFSVFFFISSFMSFVEGHAEPKTVLFIGNSYTAGSAHFIKEVFKRESTGYKLVFLNPGGKDLKHHLASQQTRRLVESRKWEHIVFQGQSQKSGLGGKHTKEFHDAVLGLCKLARKQGARPCLYMTWGRRDGDKQNPDAYPDFLAMQKKISRQYSQAARANDADVASVGHAFADLHATDKSIFASLYNNDGSHPAPPGGYLAACVFFGKITDKSPVDITWNANLNPVVAATLRKTAVKVLGGDAF